MLVELANWFTYFWVQYANLAASPSPPSRSSGLPAKLRMEGGEGLAILALDCVSTDQSDLTEVIRSNFVNRAIRMRSVRQRASDASKGTELLLNSSWHFTGSQVHVIGIPEKRDLVQCLLDPLRHPRAASPRAHLTGRAERG